MSIQRDDPWHLVFYESPAGAHAWCIASTPALRQPMSAQILAIYELPDELTTLGIDALKAMAWSGTLAKVRVEHG